MDQDTEHKVYETVADVAGVPFIDLTPESDLANVDFLELERELQVALDLEILPVAIEGAVTVADLIEKLDEILYC